MFDSVEHHMTWRQKYPCFLASIFMCEKISVLSLEPPFTYTSTFHFAFFCLCPKVAPFCSWMISTSCGVRMLNNFNIGSIFFSFSSIPIIHKFGWYIPHSLYKNLHVSPKKKIYMPSYYSNRLLDSAWYLNLTAFMEKINESTYLHFFSTRLLDSAWFLNLTYRIYGYVSNL